MSLLVRTLVLVVLIQQAAGAEVQQKEPTLRDQVRKHGQVHEVSYGEDPFLATFDQLVSRSDFIIRGRVVDEKTRLTRDEKAVLTDYTVEVLEIFKDREAYLSVGQRIKVSKWGGNIVVEDKPIRIETPHEPPVPWVVPNVFFIGRRRSPDADYEFHFAGGTLGALEIERGKMVCKDKDEKKQHPITKDFCNRATEEEFLQVLREKIARQPN